MEPADIGALLSVTACTVSAIECARHVQREPRDHRLFVSLILFALNWAILLAYYALQTDKQTLTGIIRDVRNFLPAYSGVLILFAGGALRREAVARRQIKGTGRYDTIALWCLYFLILGHAIPFVPGSDAFHQFVVILLQPLLTIVGFFSIVVGLRMLTKGNDHSWLWWIFLAIAFFYACADIFYGVILFRKTMQGIEYRMPDPFKWTFAGFKVALTSMFLLMVFRQTSKERTKRGHPVLERRSA